MKRTHEDELKIHHIEQLRGASSILRLCPGLKQSIRRNQALELYKARVSDEQYLRELSIMLPEEALHEWKKQMMVLRVGDFVLDWDKSVQRVEPFVLRRKLNSGSYIVCRP